MLILAMTCTAKSAIDIYIYSFRGVRFTLCSCKNCSNLSNSFKSKLFSCLIGSIDINSIFLIDFTVKNLVKYRNCFDFTTSYPVFVLSKKEVYH